MAMVFSIMIYFTFTSIQYNEEIAKAIGGSKMIYGAFQASSIVIAVFSAIFIWYCNSFFTRKRKNEIALYSMMGVKKKQIGRMLFYETLCMGVLALAVGIIIGGLLSRLFINILVKLMALESIKLSFSLVPKAVTQTSIVFLVLFFIASIHAYTIIFRFKLVDLFRADQSGENTPKASFILSIISVIMIAAGYRFANIDYMFKLFPISIFLVLGLTILGSYLFFNSCVVFMVKMSKKNKGRFYKGINMIGTSQLLYRIKGNARSLATIAVLSATTLTAVGTTFSFYYNNEKVTKDMKPFSYGFVTKDSTLIKSIEDTMAKYKNNSIIGSENVDVTLSKAKVPVLQKKSSKEYEDSTVNVISLSKYNALNKHLGQVKNLELKNDEAILIDRQYMENFMKNPIGAKYTLYGKDKNIELKISSLEKESIINDDLLMFTSVLVVQDEIYNFAKNNNSTNYNISLYEVQNEKNAKELSEELRKLAPKRTKEEKEKTGNYSNGYSEFYESYRAGLEGTGLMIFIGAFLGLVFLICTGSIIFFKQLSEATTDKGNYAILGKIGVTKGEVKSSIAKQLLIVFLLPLLVGLTHSAFALKLLAQILNTNLVAPVLISYAVYSVIYLLYYILTVKSYYGIIMEK